MSFLRLWMVLQKITISIVEPLPFPFLFLLQGYAVYLVSFVQTFHGGLSLDEVYA